jgi:hypothetical protein
VQVNGSALEPAERVERPLPHPYDANLLIGGTFSCFRLPRRLVRKGGNTITASFAAGDPVTIDYLDLVLP